MASIVAVSRQFGSGGAIVGRGVALRLGFKYADRDILAEAARELKVHADDLAPMEERSASIWERVGTLFALGAPDTPYIPPSLPRVTELQLFKVEQQVIKSIAAHGNAVIVGRGAAHILGTSTDVLRVFLHAPLQERITLAMNEYGLTDREKAEAIVRESDVTRANFVKTMTGKNWCDATLYDITLDTSTVGLDRAVDILVDAIRRPPATPLSSYMP